MRAGEASKQMRQRAIRAVPSHTQTHIHEQRIMNLYYIIMCYKVIVYGDMHNFLWQNGIHLV